MTRADLVLSSIKPVLFRELQLHTFSWKSFKWLLCLRQMVLLGKANKAQGGLYLRSDVVVLPYWRLEHFLLSHGEIR